MRRLSPNRTKTVYLRQLYSEVDADGYSETGFGAPIPLEMRLIPVINEEHLSSTAQPRIRYTGIYIGDDIDYRNNVGDGLCVNVPGTSDPDCKILSILPFSNHYVLTVESVK